MALDGDRLGTNIAAAIQGLNIQAGTPITMAQLVQVWQAVGREDVKEIKDNAVVNTNVAVTSVSGVMPGGGTSGPGAGTGTGTVS